MVPAWLSFLILEISWVSLILVSAWFLFRLTAFLKVWHSFFKMRNKFYYLVEISFYVILLALDFALVYLLTLALSQESVHFIFLILAIIFVCFVLIKGFSYPSKDTLFFINNLDAILSKKFGGPIPGSMGYLWAHFIGITRVSKNNSYKKIEALFRKLLILGLCGFIIFSLGVFLSNIDSIGELPSTFLFIIIFCIIIIAVINYLNKKE